MNNINGANISDETQQAPIDPDLELYITVCKGNVYQSCGDDEQSLLQYLQGWSRAEALAGTGTIEALVAAAARSAARAKARVRDRDRDRDAGTAMVVTTSADRDDLSVNSTSSLGLGFGQGSGLGGNSGADWLLVCVNAAGMLAYHNIRFDVARRCFEVVARLREQVSGIST
jgi:hypothetical protein